MATDATPIQLPANGTWIAVGPPGYGSRWFSVSMAGPVRFAHALAQPAIKADVGEVFPPGFKDTLGTDDALVTLWACTERIGVPGVLRVVA